MEPVELSRPFIVQLYCVARQAERSVHVALYAHWLTLKAYYSGERQAMVRSVRDYLRERLDHQRPTRSHANRDEMLQEVSEPGSMRYLLGPWIARWKNNWTFSVDALTFIADTLEHLLDFLERCEQPDRDALIALRTDCWACEYLIECRCHGLAELRRARHIEHFNQSFHIVPVTIQDLVPSPVAPAARAFRGYGNASQRESQP